MDMVYEVRSQSAKTCRSRSPRETLPNVLLHLRPLDVFAGTVLVDNGDWGRHGLTLARLLLRGIEMLRHALVHDLIVEHVHDLCERLARNFLTSVHQKERGFDASSADF